MSHTAADTTRMAYRCPAVSRFGRIHNRRMTHFPAIFMAAGIPLALKFRGSAGRPHGRVMLPTSRFTPTAAEAHADRGVRQATAQRSMEQHRP
jgi:hypothetical protein